MKIFPKKVVSFFDQKSKDGNYDGSDVSAIIGLLGEDLVLGVLQHYWKSKGAKSEILTYRCNSGKLKGPRLDAWLLKESPESPSKDELYQVEVKNWAAYAIGGKELKLGSEVQDLQAYSKRNWDRLFVPETIPGKNISKVLEPMKSPSRYNSLKPIPLICFWFYVAESIASPYSTRKYANGREVHVFSATAYLRSLKDDYIDVAMPRAEKRLELLSNLILEE